MYLRALFGLHIEQQELNGKDSCKKSVWPPQVHIYKPCPGKRWCTSTQHTNPRVVCTVNRVQVQTRWPEYFGMQSCVALTPYHVKFQGVDRIETDRVFASSSSEACIFQLLYTRYLAGVEKMADEAWGRVRGQQVEKGVPIYPASPEIRVIARARFDDRRSPLCCS